MSEEVEESQNVNPCKGCTESPNGYCETPCLTKEYYEEQRTKEEA